MIKLKSLQVENFKAFGARAKIPFAPITLLFGANSAGKSSILQVLYLLKQTREQRRPEAVLLPRVDAGYVDLGSFYELIFNHELERTLKIRTAFAENGEDEAIELHFEIRTPDGEIELKRLEVFSGEMVAPDFGFELTSFPDTDASDSSAVTDDTTSTDGRWFSANAWMTCSSVTQRQEYWKEDFETAKRNQKKHEAVRQLRALVTQASDLSNREKEQIQETIEFYQSDFNLAQFTEWATRRVRNTRIPLRGFLPDSHTVMPFSESSFIWQVTSAVLYRNVAEAKAFYFGNALGNLLARVFPLGPLRTSPERWYIPTGNRPRDVGYKGEWLPDLLYNNAALVEETNRWLRRFKTGYGLRVETVAPDAKDLYQIRLQEYRRATENASYSWMDVGYGISQLLPFIVQCLTAQGRIISTEQPEIHIHPQLQAELGDLLAQAIKPPYENQFLIETHSEHLILRLQKLVRKGILKKDDVSVIYVTKSKDGSRVQRLRMDDEGGFVDAWPDGFFPERLNELL